MVIYWPKRITQKGQIRSQFHHVIDVVPTILEAADLPQPTTVTGIPQVPIQGVSMVYTFDHPNASSTHKVHYFEIGGNRAIYADGWLAGTVHRAPWEYKPRTTLENDKWKLYYTPSDFSLVKDLSIEKPEKLREMQALFLKEAAANHVLPMDDRAVERINPAIAGRPDLMAGRTSLTVYPGMLGMSENVFINVKNSTYTVTADVDIPSSGANGVLIAQGGRFGGWTFYVKDGKLSYTYNWVGLESSSVTSTDPVPAGKTMLRVEFIAASNKPGTGGTVRLFANGKQIGEGKIDKTNSSVISLDEGTDVGMDLQTPVTDTYESPFKFTGTINKVTVNVKPSHLSAASQQEIDQLIEKSEASKE